MGRGLLLPVRLCCHALAAVAAGAALLVCPLAGTAAAAQVVPPGYAISAQQRLASGVEHYRLTRTSPAEVVHVARIARDAPVQFRTVLAHDAIGSSSGTERTSSICRRKNCLLAVNGDFWTPATGVPIGGVVSAGELLKSPTTGHSQLVLSGSSAIPGGALQWKGTLMSTDLRSIGIGGVNVQPAPHAIVMYTRAFGASTRRDPSSFDIALRVVRPAGPVRLSGTTIVRLLGVRRGGGTPLAADTIVLSGNGRGGAALAQLWQRAANGSVSHDVLLRLESLQPVVDSVGGGPVLLRNSKPVYDRVSRSSFMLGRHPRTIVGRTAGGGTILVTVDGRQAGYSEGMSIPEAAQLMLDLGAVDAINLDGGGSTTFVAKGSVLNRPSDRAVRTSSTTGIVHVPSRFHSLIGHVERPVATALVVVAKTPGAKPQPLDKDVFAAVALPTLNLPVPHGSDPASDPTGSLPAIVAIPDEREHTHPLRLPAAAVAAAAIALVAVADRRGVLGPFARPRK